MERFSTLRDPQSNKWKLTNEKWIHFQHIVESNSQSLWSLIALNHHFWSMFQKFDFSRALFFCFLFSVSQIIWCTKEILKVLEFTKTSAIRKILISARTLISINLFKEIKRLFFPLVEYTCSSQNILLIEMLANNDSHAAWSHWNVA